MPTENAKGTQEEMHKRSAIECFESIEAKDVDASVRTQTQATQLAFGVFMDVVKRPPSPEELDTYTKRVLDKNLAHAF